MSLPSAARATVRFARHQAHLGKSIWRHRPQASFDLDYLGWTGHANLGDEAIFLAHQRQLSPARLRVLPNTRMEQVLWPERWSSRPRRPFLLGGGTLLGRPEWLDRLQAVEANVRPTGWFMLGAGVEDPCFAGRTSYTSSDELARWAPTLARFDTVSVRGPRSAQLLADIGIPATVDGDPALLFVDETLPIAAPLADVVAFNVAKPEDVWGGDSTAVIGRMTAGAQTLVKAGLRLRLFSMHPADRAACEHIAAALPPGSAGIQHPATVDEVLDLVSDCAAHVGQRLHAVILAAARFVPSVAIEYRPKCADFQESINQGRYLLRSDGFTPEQLCELTLELVQNNSDAREAVRAGVMPLTTRLRTAADALRAAALDRD